MSKNFLLKNRFYKISKSWKVLCHPHCLEQTQRGLFSWSNWSDGTRTGMTL